MPIANGDGPIKEDAQLCASVQDMFTVLRIIDDSFQEGLVNKCGGR